jgi:hypothetical protein
MAVLGPRDSISSVGRNIRYRKQNLFNTEVLRSSPSQIPDGSWTAYLQENQQIFGPKLEAGWFSLPADCQYEGVGGRVNVPSDHC